MLSFLNRINKFFNPPSIAFSGISKMTGSSDSPLLNNDLCFVNPLSELQLTSPIRMR